MNKTIILAALLWGACAANAQNITLDLSKATTDLSFEQETGKWTGTFDDDAESIDSQCFSFVHSSMGAYKTWWGFTASNSADNTSKTDFLSWQYSNMAKGGIVLNDDGTVKTDEFGAPVVDASVPYIVGFYMAGMAARPTDMVFADGRAHEAVSVYVNLNSYAYYAIQDGLYPARAFTNGDKFILTIHGVAPDESEKTVEVPLASYTNGDLTVNRGWKYVDLSPLGVVNELYFSIDSTDKGTWGMNTPGYFCLDKLTVKAASASVSEVGARNTISYDRATRTVSLGGSEFAAVYNALGSKVMSAEGASFGIGHLPAGVYIVRSGNSSLKIVR